MMIEVVIAVAGAYQESLKLIGTIWTTLDPAQQKKIADWFIEDHEKWRNFWNNILSKETK
jgi:hypothetical protein